MKEKDFDGIVIKYKDYLDEDEFNKIIKIYIKNLVDGIEDYNDELSLTRFNYVLADTIFDRTLGLYCIENFDEELHSKLFNAGAYDFLKDDIKNAKRAYILAKEIVRNSNTLEEIIRNALSDFIKKLPNDFDVEKMAQLWEKVSNEYKNIVGSKQDDGE